MKLTRVIQLRSISVICLTCALVVAGCGGPKMVKVSGKVTLGGQPLAVEKTTQVTITFAPENQAAGQTYSAKFERDQSTYTVTVPTGTYKANVLIAPGQGKPPISSGMDKSKTYEIEQDQEINLDVPK